MCVESGVDHLGFNFVPSSKRYIDPQLAARIARDVEGRIGRVGVFMDHSLDQIEAVLREVPLDAIQLHGRETPEYCSRMRRPVWKVFAVGPGWDARSVAGYSNAAVRLYDTAASGGGSGGTGRIFDWSLLPAQPGHPWVLAGGLGPGNLAQAITLCRPDGIDLNSGVESAPGVKDPELLSKAMELVGAWRTHAVVVGLPGRPANSVELDGQVWAQWVLDPKWHGAEEELRGLHDLLEVYPRLILDLRGRDVSVPALGSQVLGWKMAARERGAEVRFRFNEQTMERLMRLSLGALLPVVEES